MALVHAQPLDIINVRPLGDRIAEVKTHSLIKTPHLQLMRLVLAAGQTVPEHQVAGEITVHCLEGSAQLHTPGRVSTLQAGDLVTLAGGEPHALEAVRDSSLLVTILLTASAR
jgi:quercetin dioxygenase-like cupin family protein